MSDDLKLSGQHDLARRLLLEGESTEDLEAHIAACPACGRLAARLAEVDRLLLEVPLPRPELLADILARTATRARRASLGGGCAVTARLHVLLVVGDPAVAEMYRVRLELDGYRVLVATDARAGLRLIRELAPELVVLDWHLPDLDGLAVLTAIRADGIGRDQPVVVLSMQREPAMAQAAMGPGIVAWLETASATPGDLSALVRRVVGLELGRQRERRT